MNKMSRMNAPSVKNSCSKAKIKLGTGKAGLAAEIRPSCPKKTVKSMQEWGKFRATTRRRNKKKNDPVIALFTFNHEQKNDVYHTQLLCL